jgi:hypothetical protein
MVKLKDIAKACKSKNAGPFEVTLDIMFEDEAVFRKVQQAKLITARVIAERYGVPEESVQFTEFPPALAYKATIRRPIPSGEIGDTDIYGAQQHAPLLDIELAL